MKTLIQMLQQKTGIDDDADRLGHLPDGALVGAVRCKLCGQLGGGEK